MSAHADLQSLPGGDLVEQGLDDLTRGVESIPSLLVSMAVTRLRNLGFDVPVPPWDSPELRLYGLLSAELGDGAHSRYNALVRRLLSFLRSARCAPR